jgi:hypothetical protein
LVEKAKKAVWGGNRRKESVIKKALNNLKHNAPVPLDVRHRPFAASPLPAGRDPGFPLLSGLVYCFCCQQGKNAISKSSTFYFKEFVGIKLAGMKQRLKAAARAREEQSDGGGSECSRFLFSILSCQSIWFSRHFRQYYSTLLLTSFTVLFRSAERISTK